MDARRTAQLKWLISVKFITPEMIEDAMELVRLGADPDTKASDGDSLLHILCKRGIEQKSEMNPAIPELINQYHADVDIQDAQGFTPLQHLISETFYCDEAMQWVRLGANPDTKSAKHNISLLHIFSVRQNNKNGRTHEYIMELVYEHHADIDIVLIELLNKPGSQFTIDSILNRADIHLDCQDTTTKAFQIAFTLTNLISQNHIQQVIGNDLNDLILLTTLLEMPYRYDFFMKYLPNCDKLNDINHLLILCKIFPPGERVSIVMSACEPEQLYKLLDQVNYSLLKQVLHKEERRELKYYFMPEDQLREKKMLKAIEIAALTHEWTFDRKFIKAGNYNYEGNPINLPQTVIIQLNLICSVRKGECTITNGLEEVEAIGALQYKLFSNPFVNISNAYFNSFADKKTLEIRFWGFERIKYKYRLDDVQARALQCTGLRYWLLSKDSVYKKYNIPFDIVIYIASTMTGTSINNMVKIYNAVRQITKNGKVEILEKRHHGVMFTAKDTGLDPNIDASCRQHYGGLFHG